MAWKSFPQNGVKKFSSLYRYLSFKNSLRSFYSLFKNSETAISSPGLFFNYVPSLIAFHPPVMEEFANKETKKERKKERLGKEIYSRLAGHPQFSRWQKSLTKYTPVYLMSNYKAFDCLIVLSLVNLLTCSRSWGLFFCFLEVFF